MFITDKAEKTQIQWLSSGTKKKCFSLPLRFFVALCVFSLKWVWAQFQPASKSKEGKRLLWALCDEWLPWTKILGVLVYRGNIMFHKFLQLFYSFKKTFYPIWQWSLCWLKATFRQTVLNSLSLPFLQCLIFFLLTVLPPLLLVDHSYLLYYFPSVFSSHLVAFNFYIQERGPRATFVCEGSK